VTNLIDEAIFGVTNAWIYLSRPRLRRRWIRRFGRFPDIARPLGHDALMQWRKVFDHNPLFVTFCDKLATAAWVRRLLPDLAQAEVLWVGSSAADIPMPLLDGNVVLKASSGSGSNYFPTRERWDEATIRNRFAAWLKRPRRGRGEWAYGRLPRRLLIERLVGTPDDLVDLTFRCQNGRIASAFAGFAQRTPEERGVYLSAEGIPLAATPIDMADRARRAVPPELFRRAAAIAATLGAGVDHVRVDLRVEGDVISFGEMTVYSSSGYGEEERVGVGALIERQWIAEIECSWFLTTPQPWPVSIYQGAFRRWVRQRQAELAVL
jgi:hypothetical protein